MGPIPVILRPILKSRPWGGRRLGDRFGKPMPPDENIGESWELVDLPPDESVVSGGPMAGRTLRALMHEWRDGLLGAVQPIGGRFPLLVKFIDARQNLSIQVHPRFRGPQGQSETGQLAEPGCARPKSEAWYIVEADPGAELFIGLRPGITREDVRAAAGTEALVGLLRRWPAKAGRCYYVPGGTPHAIGAGVLLAEIQTPSDTTYRLYDWGRRDAAGRPRDLHVSEALAELDDGIAPAAIAQPRRHVSSVLSTATRAVSSEHFTVEIVRLVADACEPIAFGDAVVWVIVSGAGTARAGGTACPFRAGDVMLLPAGISEAMVTATSDCTWLEVKIPIRSRLAEYSRPPPDEVSRADGVVRLGVPGRPGGAAADH